ncbi:hypothetical protein ACFYXF_45320 [Streptomyces sp. NPDC002680]|uniref:hypothetical protein n=1 Tax=Streptomyces sp. NPDC002680 TaxID=3364659 RepID=UPI003675FDF8
MATYRDQQSASEKEEKDKIEDFVRRVTLTVNDTKWILVNRNVDILEDVRLSVYRQAWPRDGEDELAGDDYLEFLGVMPPCSSWAADEADAAPLGNHRVYFTVTIVVSFISPDGKNWSSRGSQLFEKVPLGSDESLYPFLGAKPPALGKASFCR